MRNVIRNFPADKLPPELRQGVTARHVRVVIETEDEAAERDRLLGVMDEISAAAREKGVTDEQLADLLGLDPDERRALLGP